MKCPKCEELGLQSKVFPIISSTTCAGVSMFYDEDDELHIHDPNATTTEYNCSNEHSWIVTTYHSCWCGWTGGETAIRLLEEEQPQQLESTA